MSGSAARRVNVSSSGRLSVRALERMHSAPVRRVFQRQAEGGNEMQNTDMWTYRSSLIEIAQIDLDGFDVEARDGSIGEVDDATNDVSAQYIVVDTGPWIFGRKVVIPAALIEAIDTDNRKVVLDLTKDQIKNSPEYDPDRFDDTYRNDLSTYYASSV